MAIGVWLITNNKTGEKINGWVCGFDADANHGRGHVQVTKDAGLAKRFEESKDAWAFLKQRSVHRPGLVPMAVFEVELRQLPDRMKR